MKPDGVAYALAMLAVVAPLVAGQAYVAFAAEFKLWVIVAFLAWFGLLRLVLRGFQAMALRVPGARLGSRGLVSGGRTWGAGSLAALGIGAVLAQVAVVAALYPQLRASRAYWAFFKASPSIGWYVVEFLRWGVRIGGPLGLVGIVHFLQVKGWMSSRLDAARRLGELPPYPRGVSALTLVLGEVHHPSGDRSDTPGWLTVGEKALYAGILITGAIGTGKTEGCIFPYLRQLLGLHPGDPGRRVGALVLDAKGDMVGRIRSMCAEMERLDDLVVIGMPNARVNLVNRPDLVEPALAAYVADAQQNVQGRDTTQPYWANAAEELAMQALRVIRLAENRPPTLAQLVRITRSDVAFNQALERARARAHELQGDDADELESVESWYGEQLRVMAPHTRASIASQLSTMLSVFDTPAMRRCFSPEPEEERFPGFARLLEQGKVVVLSMPEAILKKVGRVVGTLVKFNFQDAVLQRLASGVDPDRMRPVAFVADEFDRFATPSDSDFWARCRAARCANIVAMQSYTSLFNAGLDQGRVQHFHSLLRTKIWLCAADRVTAQTAADLCGREDRAVPSQSVSENAQGTKFSFLDRTEIREGASATTASTSWHVQERYRFAPERFTELKAFQAIALPFDGDDPLPPTVLYLTRDFSDPNESWFEWRARQRKAAA